MKLSFIDKVVIGADLVLRTLSSGAVKAERASPASDVRENTFEESQRKHVAGLMRINHAGEVCAQGLYQGQALTARLPNVRQAMDQAAREEIDHLAWCEERIKQLGSHTSWLNPLWYASSFSLGAFAGAVSDKVSLGFVAATEDQVCKHLGSHLQQLPDNDHKTRAILELMLEDEARHGEKALAEGGMHFPPPVKAAMTAVSKLMTRSTYRI